MRGDDEMAIMIRIEANKGGGDGLREGGIVYGGREGGGGEG